MTTSPTELPPAKPKLFTFASGGWVLLIAGLLSALSAFIVLLPVFQTGFRRAVGDGSHIDSYGFDLSNLTIPRTDLIASGKAKDEVRAVPPSLVETVTIPEIDLMNKHDYVPFLLPSDLVIGVSINNISRAYPIRQLNVHEVVNDTLADTPLAITWSPLAGSAVVFDRRLTPTTAPVEFGVSGLLTNSTLILFDRQSDPRNESLWPQLTFTAIAGPAASKSLTRLPFTLTTWKNWSTAHPDTRTFLGLRTLKGQYNDAQDPYNMYLATDTILFPLTHTWPHPTPTKKNRITLTTTDNLHWLATPFTAGSPLPPETPNHLYAFLFAWYAQHPTDTDYTAIEK